ncbi:hypothetical protein MANES_15G138601v8 [Manihot esculenta]|uniref:Uncharacterized protein n=1 Tax=Manihot esculenta TaxID=3983 RepID=A0ACB7GDJ1_MANES|nr:hypothetical protein MANES_15G138601v8 [Manihot esculenta]
MRRETKSFKRSLRAETEGFPNFESSAKNPNKNLRVFPFSIKHRETAMWRICDCSSTLRIQAVEFLVNLLMSVPTHLPQHRFEVSPIVKYTALSLFLIDSVLLSPVLQDTMHESNKEKQFSFY